MEPSYVLRAFRQSLYDCFQRRADALFELTDALLTAGVVPSPVHLSLLQLSHRRSWGSLYAASDRGRIDAEALRMLFARHPLPAGSGTPVFAVDVSVWHRCDAESSPERGLWKERPHELSGLRARLSARMALHNFCIWLNVQLGRPRLAFADLIEW